MRIISVVGARPNFMKIAPFIRAIERHNQNAQPKIEHVLVHTGQHYDDSMSRSFFQALDIPDADINLEAQLSKAERLSIKAIIRDNALPGQSCGLNPLPPDSPHAAYGLITIHRPSNVDIKDVLEPMVNFFVHEAAKDMLLFWPVHPRAVLRLQEFGLWDRVLESPNLVLTQPIGYHELLRLNRDARLMLTDSGGLQEECCILGTPCLTLRWNTERPVTLKEHGGVSVLVGNDVEKIRKAYHAALKADRHPVRPELWDGQTAIRCAQCILS